MQKVKRQFPSSSSASVYTTLMDLDTMASSCNCPGWVYKRPGRPRGCKHTAALEKEYSGVPHPWPGTAVVVRTSRPAVSEQKREEAQAFLDSELAKIKTRRRVVSGDDSVDCTQAPPKADIPTPEGPTAVGSYGGTRSQSHGQSHAKNGAPPYTPMLARALSSDDQANLVLFLGNQDWVMEEKFDGHRLMVQVTGEGVAAWARPRPTKPAKERKLPGPLAQDLRRLPPGVYDGELVVPGGTSSDVGRLDQQDRLHVVLFDVLEMLGAPTVGNSGKTYAERRVLLELAVSLLPTDGRVLCAPAGPVDWTRFNNILNNGGEGVILKKADSPYLPGIRAPFWVKVKREGSAELTITGYRAGKAGPYSVVTLRHDDGRETQVGSKDAETYRMLEKNPDAFLGRRLVISHNGETQNAWRHPKWDHLLDAGA